MSELELDLPDFPGKKTIERRYEAFVRLMLGQFHGKPIPITPQAFNDEHHVASLCADHEQYGFMTLQQYFEHSDRLHPPDDDDNDCPHCGAPPKTRYLGLVNRFDPEMALLVVVIDGVDTREAYWRGRINFPLGPAICLVCKKEIRHVNAR